MERALELFHDLQDRTAHTPSQPWAQAVALAGIGRVEEARHEFAKGMLQQWPAALLAPLCLLFPGLSAGLTPASQPSPARHV